MKVLLAAYACEPGRGSEPGVGWHWSTELARLGHEVVVITRSNNRIPIEKALADAPIAGLHFHYYDLPPWAKWWKRGNRGVHLYYSLWLFGAYRQAKHLTRTMQFDVVHHLTFGVFRHPSFMGRLGLPFVLGPLGGGDLTPELLRGGLPANEIFREKLRGLSNNAVHWIPYVPTMFRQAAIIFCKTQETLDFLPAFCREKCRLHLEIGLEPHLIKPEASIQVAHEEFLYVGNLIYMKGLHLALKAFAELRKSRPSATFTIIGAGPADVWLKKLSATLGLENAVRWLGRIPHDEIWEHYARYTAFVFPSLHDSSGNVILEAFSQAVPVICLDTGGPGAIVSPACGIKVPVRNRNEAEVVGDLAAAMRALADDPELRAQMGRRALEVAKASTWKDVVSSAYVSIENVLDSSRKRGLDHPH